MAFSSISFLFYFLPLFFLVYWLVPARWKNAILTAGSLFFYAWGDLRSVPLLALSILVTYALGRAMRPDAPARRKKLVLILGLVFHLALLVAFKYADFFFGSLLPLPELALPLGISFYTFHAMSYLIDVYRGSAPPQKNLLQLSVYLAMFPKLVMGPIAPYHALSASLSRRELTMEDTAAGCFRFAVGLGKKALLADTLAGLVSGIWGNLSELTVLGAWLGLFGYALQLYFDFSGYSDMAVGLGKLFNIDIPFNFRSPYQSESIGVFWRRWHITLSRALQSYVYFPLGGSRAGKLRTYRNLLITFLVSGLWHGAAWTFVLWGLLHGLFNALERIFAKPLSRVPHWVRVGCTFLIVNALWVLFRAESFQSAATVYRGMVDFSNLAFAQVGSLAVDGFVGVPNRLNAIYVVGILAALAVVCFRCKNSCQMLTEFTCRKGALWATAILFCIALVHLSRESVFIYFNF